MNNKPRKPRSVLGKVLLAVRIIAVPFLLLALYYNYFSYSTVVTHSTDNIIKIQKDGYTHEIVYGFIRDNRIEFNMFLYRSDVGLNYDVQYSRPRDGFVFFYDSPAYYQIYYNGKELGDYGASTGQYIDIGAKIPHVGKNRPAVVAVYSGKEFLANVTLFPANAPPFTERPSVTLHGITITADIRRQGDELRVVCRTALPRHAELMSVFLLEGNSIWLKDADGNIYKDKSMAFYDEERKVYAGSADESLDDYAQSLMLYGNEKIFFFDVPSDLNDFTVLIPYIRYMRKANKFSGSPSRVENVYGPWEIPVSVEDIQIGY